MKMFAKTTRSALAAVLVLALVLSVCGTLIALATNVEYSQMSAQQLAALLKNGDIDLKKIVDLLEEGEITPETGVELIKTGEVDVDEATELIKNGEVSDKVISDLLDAGEVPPEIADEIINSELPPEVIIGIATGSGEVTTDTVVDLIQNGDLSPEALTAIVVAAVKAQLPIDMQEVYDYLYNNPEEVIDLVKSNYDKVIEAVKEYGDAALAAAAFVLATYGEDAAKYVVDNYETIFADFEEWVNEYGDESIALLKVYADALGLTEEAEKAFEKLGDKVDEIKKELKRIIYEATHADYFIDDESFYVALGDASAVSDSYVDYLAEMLDVDYENLAKKDLVAEDIFAVIDANKALVEKADLITIGFTSNMFSFAVAEAIDKIMAGEQPEDYDWVALAGAEYAEKIEEGLAETRELLLNEAGLDGKFHNGTYADALVAVVEAYAYEYTAHLLTYPEVLDYIHDVNPEALLVLVGMHNNIEDVVVNVEGTEVPVGVLAECIVGAANLQSLFCAIHTDNTIYVHAPEVETLKEAKGESLEFNDVAAFVWELLSNGHKLENTVVGNEYVTQCIYDALNISRATPDVSDPDVSDPDVSTPDVSEPDVSTPDVSDPDVSEPDVSTPDVSTPDVSTPDESKPEESEPIPPLGDSGATIYVLLSAVVIASVVGVYFTTKKKASK